MQLAAPNSARPAGTTPRNNSNATCIIKYSRSYPTSADATTVDTTDEWPPSNITRRA